MPISAAMAQKSDDAYTALAPLPCIESPAGSYIDSSGVKRDIPAITCGGSGNLQPEVSFKTYVQTTVNLLIALSAVAAVLMIVVGGFEYMTSTSVFGKSAGRDRATNAVYGLILVLCSYIIIRTVDPRFVEIPNTLVPKIKLKSDLTKVNIVSLDTIEQYQDEYDIRRNEIGQNLQATQQRINTNQKNIDDINAKLLDMDNRKVAANAPERQALDLEKSQLMVKITKDQTVQRINLTESTFNGLISTSIREIEESTSDATHGLSPNELRELVRKLNDNATSVNVHRDKQISLAYANGDFDYSQINMRTEYTKAVIWMLRTQLIINQRIALDTGSDFGPKLLTITMEKPDGSGQMVWPAAKKILQDEIDQAEAVKKIITDEKMKVDLTAKIEATKTALSQVGKK